MKCPWKCVGGAQWSILQVRAKTNFSGLGIDPNLKSRSWGSTYAFSLALLGARYILLISNATLVLNFNLSKTKSFLKVKNSSNSLLLSISIFTWQINMKFMILKKRVKTKILYFQKRINFDRPWDRPSKMEYLMLIV